MSDKHFVGLKITGFGDHGSLKPISRVTLQVDDETVLTAGDDTGYEITAPCPHATQVMVDSLLEQLKGTTYQMYTADAAGLDPAAELGDGVTVGGLYSVVAQISDDGEGYPDISAPGEEELEDELLPAGPTTQAFNQKIATTRSLISKTADEIRLQVEGVSGEVNSLAVTLDGVTITGPSGQTLIDGASIYTGNLTVDAANITGELTANQIDATNLRVDAANITGELTARSLTGRYVYLKDEYDENCGLISLTSATSGSYAVDLTSWSALRLTADSGNLYLSSGYGPWISLGVSGIQTSGTLYSNNVSPLGLSYYPWSAVYANTGEIITSDENRKHDIEPLPDKYLDMLDLIEPYRFKMDEGTSDRYHVGFVAQRVKEAMDKAGVDSKEFAGWCADKEEDGNDIYMLRYEEFIALLWAKIKRLEAEIHERDAKGD